jgi:hypothetical protein
VKYLKILKKSHQPRILCQGVFLLKKKKTKEKQIFFQQKSLREFIASRSAFEEC